MAAITQFHGVADFVANLRASANRRSIKLSLFHGQSCVVSFNGGLHKRHVGITAGEMPAIGGQFVQPARAHVAALHFGIAQQFHQKRFVAGSSLNNDNTLAQGALQASESFFPVPAVGNNLSDHRVEFGRDRIAFRNAGINPHARTRRGSKTLDDARGGRKSVLRIFRI